MPPSRAMEVIAVREVLQNFETEDVYEAPLLADAGEYAEATQGIGYRWPEGPLDLYLFF